MEKIDKKRYRKKENIYLKLIPCILVVSVFMISLAWSTFSQNLEIDSIGITVRAQADIRVTDFLVSSDNGFNSNGGISNWDEYNVSRVQGNINLPEKDSQVQYRVQITNFGNIEMGVFDITGLPDYLDYSIVGYNLKDKLCVENICNLGIKKDFYIIIKYKKDAEIPSNTNFTVTLDFDFRSFHTITYYGFANTSSYPREIIDGGNLNVTFNENVLKEDLYVTVGNVSTNAYTFTDNKFNLDNIKEDVVINNFKFYVNANNSTVRFLRTVSSTDFDTILMDTANFNIVLKNNDGTSFNYIDGNYKVEVISNDKFELTGTTTGTLSSGSLINEDKSLTLHIKDFTSTLDNFKLRITLLSPITKTYEFSFTVKQDGAIQYVEDLVDMTLAIRNRSNPNNLSKTDIQNQRFKLTRDLDLQNNSSYKDYSRTDYGDVNGNDKYATNLKEELTSDTGFLPIGELANPFQGGFNGGSHTISNIHIHKALQINIGFFGTIKNATIKNLTLANANITNDNQTGGMLAGRMEGGTVENIEVSGSVSSTDKGHQNQDTYTGGIVGYVTNSATIKNCTNNATVTTQFTGDTSTYSGPAGGIAAWMAHSTIENCKNYGTVIGQSYVGGIVGFSGMQLDGGTSSSQGGGTVKNCENHGTVKTYVTSSSAGGKHIGGIAGYNKAGGIIDSNTNFPEAIVTGLTNVGGIVGNNASGGTVTNNKNQSSSITGTKKGGIVGTGTAGSGNTSVI